MFAKGICAETQKFEKVEDIRQLPEYKALYERRKRDNRKSVHGCERKVRNAISPHTEATIQSPISGKELTYTVI